MASLGMANISDGSIMSIMSSVMYSFLMALYVYTVSRSNKDKSHQSTKGSYLKPPAALPAQSHTVHWAHVNAPLTSVVFLVLQLLFWDFSGSKSSKNALSIVLNVHNAHCCNSSTTVLMRCTVCTFPHIDMGGVGSIARHRDIT